MLLMLKRIRIPQYIPFRLDMFLLYHQLIHLEHQLLKLELIEDKEFGNYLLNFDKLEDLKRGVNNAIN